MRMRVRRSWVEVGGAIRRWEMLDFLSAFEDCIDMALVTWFKDAAYVFLMGLA
jgi:hypothetical protein